MVAKKYDVLIVGAGVTGASTAYHLKTRMPGLDILVTDMYPACAQGNTGRSASHIRDTVTSEVNLALCHSSIEAYKAFQASGNDLGLDMAGYLWLMSENQWSNNRAAIDMMRKNGIAVREFDQSQLSRDLPQLNFALDPEVKQLVNVEDVRFALLGENCGSIDPVSLTRYYMGLFIAAGGQVRYGSNITDLVFTEDGEDPTYPIFAKNDKVYGVKTKEGEIIFADKVVLATGAYTPKLLQKHGMPSYILPVKRHLCEVPTSVFNGVTGFITGKGLPFVILPNGIYFWEQSQGVISIGYANKRGVSLEDDPPAAESDYFNPVIAVLGEYFPQLTSLGKGEVKPTAGYYDYTYFRDGTPNIDEIIGTQGLFISNGSSGRGIMTADAIGRITAARILGEENAILYDGKEFPVSRLSVDPLKRSVDKEKFTL